MKDEKAARQQRRRFMVVARLRETNGPCEALLRTGHYRECTCDGTDLDAWDEIAGNANLV